MTKFRRAGRDDLPAVLSLIEKGFALQGINYNETEGKEHRLLFSYLYSQPQWDPERLFLAERDGRILAAVGFFPQTLFFEEEKIPVWAISPVVTAPEHRGEGLASTCLLKALEYLNKFSIPAVFLWGLPTFYPKLGFVPILPRYKSKLTGKSCGTGDFSSGRFRECAAADLPSVSALYNLYNEKLWLQPQRNLNWWQQRLGETDIESAQIKEVPFPKKENLLVWENKFGEVTGYLNYAVKSAQKVEITEALTVDLHSAVSMLECFLPKYIKADQILIIRGTPLHPLNMAAYRLGGLHFDPAPLAGMARVIDWPLFLKLLTPLFIKRLSIVAPPGKEIGWTWNVKDLVISFCWSRENKFKIELTKNNNYADMSQETSLTRLLFGLYDSGDLERFCLSEREQLQSLFPAKYPFIWDANYLY